MNKMINFKPRKLSSFIILAFAVFASSCILTEAKISISKEPIQLGILHDQKYSAEFQATILTATNLINKQNIFNNWSLHTTVIEVIRIEKFFLL